MTVFVKRAILTLLISFALFATVQWLKPAGLPELPAPLVFNPTLIKKAHSPLWNHRLGADKQVWASRGGGLFRLNAPEQEATLVYKFDTTVQAIFQRPDGLLLVATDAGSWDSEKPSILHRSLDNGLSFSAVKTVYGGSFLNWSLTASKKGVLFAGEYGPRKNGYSKTVWRSVDDGLSWQSIFEAPDNEKTHIHAVRADPTTDIIWLSIGDGKNRQLLRSLDLGENWQHMRDNQPTAIAFTPESVVFGKDLKGEPGVFEYNKEKNKFKETFDPSDKGNYGGSIYDLSYDPAGFLYVPFMKYPDQTHASSLWVYAERSKQWRRLMQLPSFSDKAAGFKSIAGPDANGWVHVTGYAINSKKVHALFE